MLAVFVIHDVVAGEFRYHLNGAHSYSVIFAHANRAAASGLFDVPKKRKEKKKNDKSDISLNCCGIGINDSWKIC